MEVLPTLEHSCCGAECFSNSVSRGIVSLEKGECGDCSGTMGGCFRDNGAGKRMGKWSMGHFYGLRCRHDSRNEGPSEKMGHPHLYVVNRSYEMSP